MGNVFDALKAGAKAAVGELGPGEFSVAGRPVQCGHCGGAQFILRSVPGQDVGALAHHGFALRCENCSFVMLFSDAPSRK